MQFEVLRKDGSASGNNIAASEDIFGKEPNHHVIYLSVKAYLANQRQGTHKAKERGEVNGGGKKPWKQKGKGGARSGTSRSPLWVGGGTIFGPKPRDYRQFLNKKTAALAKASALSAKAKDNQIIVVEDFDFDAPKTKSFVEVLSALKVTGKKVLFLTNGFRPNLYKSGRNIDRVQVMEGNKASTYDLLNNQILIVQEGAFNFLNNTGKNAEVA